MTPCGYRDTPQGAEVAQRLQQFLSVVHDYQRKGISSESPHPPPALSCLACCRGAW